MNVLIDTNVLSEPMRKRPDAVVLAELEQGGHSLQTASLVIHELSYGIQRLADGRRKDRFRSYLQNLLSSGLPVLPYDNAAALWHGEENQLSSCSPSNAAKSLMLRVTSTRPWVAAIAAI